MSLIIILFLEGLPLLEYFESNTVNLRVTKWFPNFKSILPLINLMKFSIQEIIENKSNQNKIFYKYKLFININKFLIK